MHAFFHLKVFVCFFVVRKSTTNECSQFIRRTDRKVFYSGFGHLLKKCEKQIISSCQPTCLSSPHIFEAEMPKFGEIIRVLLE